MKEDRFEELMVKVVDTVASAREREELMGYLADKPALRKELEQHQAIKAVTDGWVERLEHDLAQARYEQRTVPRLAQAAAVALVVLGTGVLGMGGTALLFADPEVPMWVRLGSSLLVAGVVLALGVVVHWRVSTHADDPYNEVER